MRVDQLTLNLIHQGAHPELDLCGQLAVHAPRDPFLDGGLWSRTQNTSPFQHVMRTPKYLTDRDLFRHRDITR